MIDLRILGINLSSRYLIEFSLVLSQVTNMKIVKKGIERCIKRERERCIKRERERERGKCEEKAMEQEAHQ